MTLRWIIAGAAAFALALLTLPFGPTASHAHAHAVEGAGGTVGAVGTMLTAACDADSRPANFDFTLQDMNGDDVDLESLKGKVVLLNFWATWCGPCKIEIPWFVEFAEQYKDDGLVVLGLSVDDTVDKIQAFAGEYDVTYPMLVGLGREDFQEAYGPIWGIPMTFFIDREGAICRTHAGIATREEFEKDVADLL
jgi:peroxiredoxin